MRAAFLLLAVCASIPAAARSERVFLDNSVILIHDAEPSYVRRGASDLAVYLREITGTPVPIVTSAHEIVRGKRAIVVGRRLATQLGAAHDLTPTAGREHFVIEQPHDSRFNLVIAGHSPHGTNDGVATLMRMIRSDGNKPYIDGVPLRSRPDIAMRGWQAGGWPIKDGRGARSAHNRA